jgi:2-oxoglutarate ferredoxin oxidoreductase subunit gamma
VLEKIIVAGFGGQGVLFLGKLLAQTAMDEGRHVTYFPSYGPEIRGGKANCHITVSADDIFSPVIAHPHTLIAMSQLSWDFFAGSLRPNGLAVVNASMVTTDDGPRPQQLVTVPATDVAVDLGDIRATNMVMLGAYIRVRELLGVDVLVEHLRGVLSGRKADLFELNRRALQKGYEAASP